MSEPLAHLYDLALRALDEQERRVDALRGRLGPVLAAAALGTSLLSGPTIGGFAPKGVAGIVAIALALSGLLATLSAAAYLVGGRRFVGLDSDPRGLLAALQREGLLDDDALFFDAMIGHLGRRRAHNAAAILRLEAAFTAMLCGILVMQCGLALAAIVG